MSKTCPSCGSELPTDAPGGMCPKCLLAGGLNDSGKTSDYTPFEPPSVAEVAALFPQLEIIELLGAGGMGAVYKARQPGLDRIVALKVLPQRDDPAFAERFTREARTLAKLNHPGIVTVFDFGQTAGLYYFVMEYVEGVNLREAERAGTLKPAEALAIVPQICTALQFAHDAGVVHRDIKPENILLDKQGRVKIADFGLAKLLTSGTTPQPLTHTHQVMGTIHYMAPEQWEKPATVDHRADIYSLGVVFYELLTGELPLGRFPLPSETVHVDVRLDEIVLRTLEKQPDRRYQHASDVKTDVEKVTTPAMERAAAGRHMELLLDETDHVRRKMQNIVGPTATIFLLILPLALEHLFGFTLSFITFPIGLILIWIIAVIPLLMAWSLKQHWETIYKGHRIIFEGGMTGISAWLRGTPVLRLYMDGRCVAQSGWHRCIELDGTVPSGEGTGDRIIACPDVGFSYLHLRLFAEVTTVPLIPIATSPPKPMATIREQQDAERTGPPTSKREEPILLFDETDRSARRLQHFAGFAGLFFIGFGLILAVGFTGLLPFSIALCAGGVGLLVVAGRIRQQWEVDYLGHIIRFENGVFTSGSLMIDGRVMASGGIGLWTELNARIPSGPGAGDRIVARTNAGLLSFRLRLFVQPAAAESSQGNTSNTTVPKSTGQHRKEALAILLAVLGVIGVVLFLSFEGTGERGQWAFRMGKPDAWLIWENRTNGTGFELNWLRWSVGIGVASLIALSQAVRWWPRSLETPSQPAAASLPSFYRHVALPVVTFGVLWGCALAILAARSSDLSHDFVVGGIAIAGVDILIFGMPLLIWRWLAKRRQQSMLAFAWNCSLVQSVRAEPFVGHAALFCFVLAIAAHGLNWIHGNSGGLNLWAHGFALQPWGPASATLLGFGSVLFLLGQYAKMPLLTRRVIWGLAAVTLVGAIACQSATFSWLGTIRQSGLTIEGVVIPAEFDITYRPDFGIFVVPISTIIGFIFGVLRMVESSSSRAF
ncbi:MAG: serine/threonine-protein kinase [Gemmataceae bacterium]